MIHPRRPSLLVARRANRGVERPLAQNVEVVILDQRDQDRKERHARVLERRPNRQHARALQQQQQQQRRRVLRVDDRRARSRRRLGLPINFDLAARWQPLV